MELKQRRVPMLMDLNEGRLRECDEPTATSNVIRFDFMLPYLVPLEQIWGMDNVVLKRHVAKQRSAKRACSSATFLIAWRFDWPAIINGNK